MEDKCPICKKVRETTLHALWECKSIRYSKFDWLSRTVMGGRSFSNFFDLINDCSTRLTTYDLKLFCVSSWRVWCSRNSTIHDKGKLCNLEVGWWSRNYIDQLQALKSDKGKVQPSEVRGMV
ncbi:hypothetical protein Ddye_015183 [Dipteronia dyeriana]|uniref:Reverse transcriptase zinc-binding domain-containing protein n=1 Tax=Dipteronia dyeriana TaxID=168575 RepID=A0AAD9U4Y5_9ROSI|nr:hypothetical protein Ddye_015183 [Dipteronia dyeriana]